MSVTRNGSRFVAGLAAMMIAMSVVGACSGTTGSSGTSVGAAAVDTLPGPYDYDFTIPAGTGEAIDAGERPDVFPSSLDVRVGETIRIVNADDRGHTMGTFFVLANSTLTYRFSTPGEFEGECTVNPEDGFVLTIRP